MPGAIFNAHKALWQEAHPTGTKGGAGWLLSASSTSAGSVAQGTAMPLGLWGKSRQMLPWSPGFCSRTGDSQDDCFSPGTLGQPTLI